MAGQPTVETGGRRRWSSPFAVVLGVAYVAWRAYDTLDGVPTWLGVSTLVVEALGVAGTTALLVALRRPRRRVVPVASTDDTPTATERLGPVDVVVRFDGQPIGHLHATLAGVRHMFDVQRVAVVTGRVEAATKAVAGTNAVVVDADPNDTTRLKAAADFGQAPFVAVFDAGDVPQPGFTGAIRSEFTDPTVAVVQGCLAPDGVDSAERDARGRHELGFERDVMNPTLGDRGAAVLLGSGAMLRRDSLRSVAVPGGARRSAELRWSIKVRAAGFTLRAPARPMVSTASINTDRAVNAMRRCEVGAALATLLSRHNPLWTTRLRISDRTGYLGWMVRPLSGVRRVAFIALLVACIATGSSPVRPQSSAWILVGLWAGWFALQGLTVQQCSDGVLQAGDRARWSMRTMGASLAALFGAGRRSPGGPIVVPLDTTRDGSWRGAGRHLFLVCSLLVVASIWVAIGIDRWHDFLPDRMTDDLDGWTRAAFGAVSVWTVAVMLDVMRCLIGGPQLRANQRSRVRLDATVDGSSARLTNLSPRGASVSFDDEADLIVGDQATMRFLVPTGSGTTAEVATIATVRSVRYDQTDRGFTLVCGVEFGTMDRVSADALFVYCSVVHPDRLAMESPAEQQLAVELIAGPGTPPRLEIVRVLGVLALLGIGASMMPPYGETAAAAPADPRSSITVRLINADTGAGVDGATIMATCVAATSVIDDSADVAEIERIARDITRTQLQACAARAADDAAQRDLRRETSPSKQATQFERWLDQRTQSAAASTAASTETSSNDRSSSTTEQSPRGAVGWHRVPSVETTETAPIAAADRGDGTYAVSGVSGSPCRLEATALPAGYIESPLSQRPLGSDDGDLVQFAQGGEIVRMDVVPATPSVDPLIELGDRVWLDSDGNGLQGPAEPGLDGVTVTLTVDDTVHRVVTDQHGSFRFSNDPKGRRGVGVEAGIADLKVGATVQIEAPDVVRRGAGSFHLTAAGAGPVDDASVGVAAPVTSPTIDSSVDPVSGRYTFAIQSAAGSLIDHSIDIGYSQAHSLGDRVWLDADNDGLFEPTEQGVDGVTVLLYVDQAGDGVPDGHAVAAQITAQGGKYVFGGLPAGGYVVEVHPPDGMVSSTGSIGRIAGPYEPADAPRADPDDGNAPVGGDAVDADDDGTMLATGAIRSRSIALGIESSVAHDEPHVDFGLFPARAIDDAVWFDEDGDGVLSPDEPGLAGVPMVLLRDDQVLAITLTDAEGDFVFPNLTLGEYTVQIHASPGLRPIDALPPQTDEGELIGEAEPPLDEPAAGTDPGTDPDADPGVGTTLDPAVDALDGVVDGVFNGVIEPAAGNAAPTSSQSTTPIDQDADNPARGPQVAVQLAAAVPADDPPFEVVQVSVAPDWAGTDAARALQRFGLWAPRSIGHMVWEDADDDGAIDPGEHGIPGIEVRLLEGDRVVGRTLSAVDGTYRFVDLPDGTYRVSVDMPSTWRTSSIGWDDPSGAMSGIDSGMPTRATRRVVSVPIRIDRVEVDAVQSFEHANIGMFQPRPTIQVDASVRGCSPDAATGARGPRGTCIGIAATAPDPAADASATDDPATSAAGDASSTAAASAGAASGDNPIVVAGSTVTFSYVVTNVGNVPMSGVTVADDVVTAGDVDCNGAADGNGQPLLLEVAHSVTCTTSGRVAAGQGRRTATVTASAESAPGSITEISPVTDTTYWFGSVPGLSMRAFVVASSPGADANGDGVLDVAPTRQPSAVDDADRPAADSTASHVVADGTQVWWVYEVHNTGTALLSEVTVTDEQRGRVCGDLVLAPGAHQFCVAPATLTRAGSVDGRSRAVASVTGVETSDPTKRGPVGPVSDAAHAYVVAPELQIAVAISGAPASGTPVAVTSGDTVELSYSVTNTGDVAYEWVALADALAGLIDCPELNVGRGGLEPDETVVCTFRRQLEAPPPAAGGASSGSNDAAAPGPRVDTLVRAEGQPVSVEGDALDTVIVETTWSHSAAAFRVGDEAFLDTDGDAEHDAGPGLGLRPAEAPMADVEVRLLDDRQQVVATSTTGTDGGWTFTSLPPGTYSIEYVVPQGYVAAMSSPGGVRIIQPDPSTRTVVTDPVLIDDPSDVPAWPLALVRLAALSDVVWTDRDADGVRDASEPGVGGVPVVIADAAGATIARTSTDDDGRWSFGGLRPGVYHVTVSAPTGYEVHRLGASVAPTQDLSADVVSSGITGPDEGASAGAFSTWLTPVSHIDDRVWNDVDGDGWLLDGERGLSRVIVTLLQVDADTATPVAVTTTDSIGRYSFDGVTPGDYVIALGAVPAGTPAAAVTTDESVADRVESSSIAAGTVPATDVVRPASAVRAGGSSAPVVVDGSPILEADLSLAVDPATRARIVPGRAPVDQPSILDPNDLLPTSAAEWVQAVVFVLSMLVVSTVVATARRRRLL